MHVGALAAGCQAEQPAAAADVEEGPAGEVLAPQPRQQRCLGRANARLVDRAEECLPVLAELEPVAGGDLLPMARGSRMKRLW